MLPWAEMMRTAISMGVAPDVFWRLSLAEWRWLTGSAERGFERTTLEGLMMIYPDRSTKNGCL